MKRFLTVLFVLLTINLTYSQKSLKDSLLMIYTEKQLRDMTSRELGNSVRKIRGQEQLPPIGKIEWTDEDQYGIKLLNNVNSDSLEGVINNHVSLITSQSDGYTMKIFPNSYVDIINRFEYGFYANLKSRQLRHKNYHELNYDNEGDESFKLINYTNNSKRTYFFDNKNSIKKIILETGKSVNEGIEYDWPFPIQYQKTIFYISQGDLQYVKQTFLGETFKGDVSSINVDDTLIKVEVKKYYFYKNNCISSYLAQSNMQKQKVNSEDDLQFSSTNCNNELAAYFENYMKEYSEFNQRENDYLQPHKGSTTQPEIVLPIEN